MMPELPKRIVKREAEWTTDKFAEWLYKNPLPSGPVEIKVTKRDCIPFSAVEPHQLASLVACTTDRGFWYKIPDLGRRNPFDGFYYRNSPAWIVIKYPKGFAVIGAVTFSMEKDRSVRKSLTWERALEICVRSVRTK